MAKNVGKPVLSKTESAKLDISFTNARYSILIFLSLVASSDCHRHLGLMCRCGTIWYLRGAATKDSSEFDRWAKIFAAVTKHQRKTEIISTQSTQSSMAEEPCSIVYVKFYGKIKLMNRCFGGNQKLFSPLWKFSMIYHFACTLLLLHKIQFSGILSRWFQGKIIITTWAWNKNWWSPPCRGDSVWLIESWDGCFNQDEIQWLIFPYLYCNETRILVQMHTVDVFL